MNKQRVMMKRKLGLLIFSLLLMALPLQAAEDPCEEKTMATNASSDIVKYWDMLNAARGYRETWFKREQKDENGNFKYHKTHKELIVAYRESKVSSQQKECTPQQWFQMAILGFESIYNGPETAFHKEAKFGLQEAVNEYMAGQSLLGNDYLVKGLRVRFPGTGDEEDPDQLTLLTLSERNFREGINRIVDTLRNTPETMRDRGPESGITAIFVDNYNLDTKTATGERVENEFFRFTNLVERYAMAANSKGKRMFFFGNVKDVDNAPLGNFPGPEDLDLNNNNVQDEAGRTEAAEQLKRSAHATWMHTAILTALQGQDEFNRNNGNTLKRQIRDSERVFDDIKSGFNPLKLQGDFVPYQPVENFLNLARARVQDAINAEGAAARAERLYDQDSTQLRDVLRNQKEHYIDRLSQLTGLNPEDYDLFSLKGRNNFIESAKTQAQTQGTGQLGLQWLAIKDAKQALAQIQENNRQVPDKIRIEEKRQQQTGNVIYEDMETMAALTYAERLASIAASGCNGVTCTQAIGFGLVGAAASSQKEILSNMQQVEINGINSAATVEQMLLELAIGLQSEERAKLTIKREVAQYEELLAELNRTIVNYNASNEDMAKSYYKNPAYRLDRDQLVEAAEQTFETAMVESYYAAKALEYFWSEKFNNPVMRLDGGLPEALSVSFDPFVRAESVFSAKFADNKSPSLDDFLDALQAWDLKMRQLRGPATQSGAVNLSMRKDILSFGTDDVVTSKRLFRNFIREHRKKGLNSENNDLEFEFTLEIGDERFFPDHPNIKIEDISVNLVSGSVRSVRNGETTMPALVDLVQLDQAHVRSFFAEYPTDDDLLLYNLDQGRTLEKSPFIATVGATIDNFASPMPKPNVQLNSHSPAVTRWVLRIKMNRGQNQNLQLEHLEDIEILFNYSYGKPRNISFPG